MNLCTRVSEEGDDGEGPSPETPSLLSYTLRYISFREVDIIYTSFLLLFVIYYESLKGEVKTKNYIWISE